METAGKRGKPSGSSSTRQVTRSPSSASPSQTRTISAPKSTSPAPASGVSSGPIATRSSTGCSSSANHTRTFVSSSARNSATGLPPVEVVDRLLELVEPGRAEGADRPVRVDDDVRRHAAYPESAGELGAGVEQDRPLDAPHLAEPLDLGTRLRPFPNVDQHVFEARPGRLANAQLLEERRLRVARSSPGGEEIEDVLLLGPVVVRPALTRPVVLERERRQLAADERARPLQNGGRRPG